MKHYNTTDLNPEQAFNRHIFHRDQFAHYLRWSHVVKNAKIGDSIVDFGCGSGAMLELMYRNRYSPKSYIGIDIRKNTILSAQSKYEKLDFAKFICDDLINPTINFSELKGDVVCSFEVLEHVGKQNGNVFLDNFLACGSDSARYYLSTPCYDPNVGAAGNHTYDSGDGRGVDIQEFTHNELAELLVPRFNIISKYGTFASQRDYKPLMNDWQKQMFETLSNYYDSNLLANLMAPMFPEHSRNVLWVLERKQP